MFWAWLPLGRVLVLSGEITAGLLHSHRLHQSRYLEAQNEERIPPRVLDLFFDDLDGEEAEDAVATE